MARFPLFVARLITTTLALSLAACNSSDAGHLQSPADLVEREGCAVFLKIQPDGSFQGSTCDKECTSQLRGATYAASEFTLAADQVVSWGRGWDADDQQVWGAETSGYVFDRVK